MQIKSDVRRTLRRASWFGISSPAFAARHGAAHPQTQEPAAEAPNAMPAGDAGKGDSDRGLSAVSLPSLAPPQRSGMPPLYRYGFAGRVRQTPPRVPCRQGRA
jgi:hypothetical protein